MAGGLYILSEDLQLLVDRWSDVVFGQRFRLDYPEIRRRLHGALSVDDRIVYSICAEEISEGMRRLADACRLPVISIDPVYLASQLMLHVTRCVDEQLNSIAGIHPRPLHASIDQQLDGLVAELGASPSNPVRVVLADDVVFTGQVVRQVIELLQQRHVHVATVVAGVVIALESSNPYEICEGFGVSLDAVHTFPRSDGEQVIDEICERDFFVFCPMTGRTVLGQSGNHGAPYIHPFGRADKWASFDGHASRVSAELVDLNIWVVEQMNQQLGRPVEFSDLLRQPNGVRVDAVDSESLLEHLKHHRQDG